jgi:hypothetical protein
MENKSQEDRGGDLPSCATEFIRHVVRKMGYRKKARQEVEAELAAHFDDEVRGCTEAQEKEQKAERLIEHFGDAKLLAVLCRRGKKRCRPLWAKMMVRSLQAAPVLMVLLTLYVAWFVRGKPSVRIDYLALLNQMSRPQVAEADNAWPYYERAVALLIGPNSDLQAIPAFEHPDYVEHREFAGLPDDAQRVIGQWLEANRVAWEDFVAAGSKPYLAKSYQVADGAKESWLMSVRVPDLSALRNLSRVGVWLSRRDVSQGRAGEALDDCLAVARAGRHWQQSVTIVEQLVALAMVRMAEEEILHIVGHQRFSATELAGLQRQLAVLYPQRFPLLQVESERLLFRDVVQHVFTDGGPGGGHVIPAASAALVSEAVREDYGERAGSPLLWTTLSLLHAGRDETVAKAEAIYDYQRELSLFSPYEKRARQVTTAGQMVRSLPRHRYALVQAMMPALDRTMELGFRGRALHEATLTVLALQRYRQEKGSYPPSLDELKTGDYLDVLSADPYSDKLLSYKVADGSFVLYSLGPDFDDDDGESGRDKDGRPKAWADQGDTVFWPVGP